MTGMKPAEMTVGFQSGGDCRGRLDPESPHKQASNPPKTRVGAPNGNTNRLNHGVHALTKLVKTLGTDRAIDKRTAAGKALARWRADLIADLGDDVSTHQDAIISLAVKPS